MSLLYVTSDLQFNSIIGCVCPFYAREGFILFSLEKVWIDLEIFIPPTDLTCYIKKLPDIFGVYFWLG